MNILAGYVICLFTTTSMHVSMYVCIKKEKIKINGNIIVCPGILGDLVPRTFNAQVPYGKWNRHPQIGYTKRKK